MSISGVIKNIKKYGISGAFSIYKKRSSERKSVVSQQDALLEDEMKDSDIPKEAYEEYARKMKDPKEFKHYLGELHDKCIKEEIPKIYAEYSKLPVENKIIIMERGKAPTPSTAHIGRVLKKQGKYEVKYISLHIRKVSYLKYYENVKNFIKEMATAKAVLISAANDYLSFIDVRPETKIIQLWHGVGMFKKVGYSTIDSKGFGPSKEYREEFNQYKNYTYVTIASKNQAWVFEDAMRIKADSGILAPVGISRTDLFFSKKYLERSKELLKEQCPGIGDRKVILYAPTFRGVVTDPVAPDKLDIRAMAEALSDEYVLLIKHHSVCKARRAPLPKDLEDDFVYDINSRKKLGIERLLAIADICITDYSSIAFEYSIMEKPIIFYAYDLEDYIDERGMYFDYDEITPGPVCKKTSEIIDYIEGLPGTFNKQEVVDFKNKYVDMCDGHATERTIDLIEK